MNNGSQQQKSWFFLLSETEIWIKKSCFYQEFWVFENRIKFFSSCAKNNDVSKDTETLELIAIFFKVFHGAQAAGKNDPTSPTSTLKMSRVNKVKSKFNFSIYIRGGGGGGGGRGGGAETSPFNFFPVTFTNLEMSPQNILVFSLNLFARLL